MERHCHGSLSGREVAVVPHQWNLLEIHPQNLLEICCLGCCGKLFTGRCLSPLQNRPRGSHQGKLMATGGCRTLEKAPAQRSPPNKHSRSRRAEPLPPACLSRAAYRQCSELCPLAEEKIFKGLWSIISEQATQGEFGAQRQ